MAASVFSTSRPRPARGSPIRCFSCAFPAKFTTHASTPAPGATSVIGPSGPAEPPGRAEPGACAEAGGIGSPGAQPGAGAGAPVAGGPASVTVRPDGAGIGVVTGVAVPKRRNDSAFPAASLASIQLNPSGEESSAHRAGVAR